MCEAWEAGAVIDGMKRLRLRFVDVDQDSIGSLLGWLEDAYVLEFDDKNPDFVIHSCFGRDVLKYDAVRVAWLGENVQPDFNISDYALGFGHITFGDRYRRVPLYRWYIPEYESLFAVDRSVRRINGREELAGKTRFCTAVVSNASRGDAFERLTHLLSAHRRVDSGGRWRNNVGGPVEDKLAFVSQGKFHIAFENSSTPGYVTEKIMHAFAARTIPIYWGAPDVALDFNPKAFINCHEYASMDEVVERVRELDRDDAAYAAMLEEPCFAGGVEPPWLSKREIMGWLEAIFDQSRDAAYRRNRQFWGVRYQNELYTAFFRPVRQAARLVLNPVIRRLRASGRFLA
jgi:hypothetical protein